MSRILAAVNGTEYWMSAVVAMFMIERFGRRKLMFVGLVGMTISMALLAAMVSQGWRDAEGNIVLETAEGVVATIMLFTFNTFFAIGFLGMTWLYPAEINPLRTRVQANALSTCSNWLSNYVIVMITPPAMANIGKDHQHQKCSLSKFWYLDSYNRLFLPFLGYGIYVIFAVFNFCFIPIVYFFYPETKGRSLEELDVLFAKAHDEKVSPVKMAKRMPHLEGAALERELAYYFDNGSSEGSQAEKAPASTSVSSADNEKPKEVNNNVA